MKNGKKNTKMKNKIKTRSQNSRKQYNSNYIREARITATS